MLTSSPLDAAASVEYGDFWTRLGAAFIDFVIGLPLFFAVSYYMTWSPNFNGFVATSVVSMLYRPVTEAVWSATPGKMICKLRVVREGDYSRIGVQEAVLRFVPWLVPTLVGLYFGWVLFNTPGYREVDGFMEMGMFMQRHQAEIGGVSTLSNLSQFVPLLSALLIFFTARNRAAHDLLAQTYVVRRETLPRA